MDKSVLSQRNEWMGKSVRSQRSEPESDLKELYRAKLRTMNIYNSQEARG